MARKARSTAPRSSPLLRFSVLNRVLRILRSLPLRGVIPAMQTLNRRLIAAAVIGAACSVTVDLVTLAAWETSTVASNYVFDGTFPKLPLPNKWTFGGVQALAVDEDDVVWMSHRPNDLNETENFASLDPP